MQPPDLQDLSRHAWCRRPGVLLRTFDDEALALAYDPRLARTHLIDELAGTLLDALGRGHATVEQLCDTLAHEFDLAEAGSRELLESRAATALQALASAGLVTSEPVSGT